MTRSDVNNLFRKEQINLNTIVAIVGFLSTFAVIVATWSSIQYRQAASEKWQQEHETLHATIKADAAALRAAYDVRINGMADNITKLQNSMAEMQYRLTSAEKGVENGDTRTSRITESYGNQFTEIRGQLASLSTQIALANDSLKRLETIDRTPRELRSN